jgi:hypothetical protein
MCRTTTVVATTQNSTAMTMIKSRPQLYGRRSLARSRSMCRRMFTPSADDMSHYFVTRSAELKPRRGARQWSPAQPMLQFTQKPFGRHRFIVSVVARAQFPERLGQIMWTSGEFTARLPKGTLLRAVLPALLPGGHEPRPTHLASRTKADESVVDDHRRDDREVAAKLRIEERGGGRADRQSAHLRFCRCQYHHTEPGEQGADEPRGQEHHSRSLNLRLMELRASLGRAGLTPLRALLLVAGRTLNVAGGRGNNRRRPQPGPRGQDTPPTSGRPASPHGRTEIGDANGQLAGSMDWRPTCPWREDAPARASLPSKRCLQLQASASTITTTHQMQTT